MPNGNILSLRTPKRAKSVSCLHFVKRGILGIRMVLGFMLDWVDGRSIACLSSPIAATNERPLRSPLKHPSGTHWYNTNRTCDPLLEASTPLPPDPTFVYK